MRYMSFSSTSYLSWTNICTKDTATMSMDSLFLYCTIGCVYIFNHSQFSSSSRKATYINTSLVHRQTLDHSTSSVHTEVLDEYWGDLAKQKIIKYT